MGNAETYRKRAAECAALARTCPGAEHRAAWLDLEQHWLRLAREQDLYQQVDPFAAFALAQTRAGAH